MFRRGARDVPFLLISSGSFLGNFGLSDEVQGGLRGALGRTFPSNLYVASGLPASHVLKSGRREMK